MGHRVISTKTFANCLRELSKKGKKGKDAILKARAAQAEAAETGEISILPRTNHGESRLKNVEKFNLGDGYRLVVQIVDGQKRERAFLYAGDHEDAEKWLDNHRDYVWVKKSDDGTLDFVQITDPRERYAPTPEIDVDTPESLLRLPLLRDVRDSEWPAVLFNAEVVHYLKQITAEDWEQDPHRVAEHIEERSGLHACCLAIDLLQHAHRKEWDQVHRRLEIEAGSAAPVDGEEAANAMADVVNSEQFVTWDDLEGIPDGEWADWMLFLHPEQKQFVARDFGGPARLRGVSGSGKTCVMVHRARHLAKKYRQPILLVTLTDSTRQLLDVLVKALCGAESALIRTATMNAIATNVIQQLSKDGLRSFTMAHSDRTRAIRDAVTLNIRNHPAFDETVLAQLSDTQLSDFVADEVAFVRMRFLPEEYDKYLTVARHGRGLRLSEKARAVMLNAVNEWDALLAKSHQKDHEAVAQSALGLLQASRIAARRTFQFRCVLVDEVQDLSQIEMRILSQVPDADGKAAVDLPDGMFLVGDGAQTIYKKGFSLKACGVPVANRSFVLKKNYRNTREILQAAYSLIEKHEFADVDEDNVQAPQKPDMSSRHGERPFIVKCLSQQDEELFVVKMIQNLVEEQRLRDEANELEGRSELPIGVIAFSRADRLRITEALERAKIPTLELREDVTWKNDAVKISTLESAKGHEFHAVFIIGVCQGVMPQRNVEQTEWKREAARLYVAMTRARDRLFMSYDIGGRNGPSVFLSAIQNECADCEFKGGKLVVSE